MPIIATTIPGIATISNAGIRFTSNIDFSTLKFSKVGLGLRFDVMHAVDGTWHSFTIGDYFTSSGAANLGYEKFTATAEGINISYANPYFAKVTMLGWDAKADTIIGFSANDTMMGYGGNDYLDGAAGDDTITGGVGNDKLIGNAGNDLIFGDTAYGTDGSPFGPTVSSSLTYNDLILGGSGNDVLHGERGNDTLDGGTGNDILIGGEGADVYRFGKGYGQDLVKSGVSFGDNSLQTQDSVEITGAAITGLRYSKVGNDMVMSIIGTRDTLTFDNFYNSDTTVQKFTVNKEFALDRSNVDKVVKAWADYDNSGGTLPLSSLHATLANCWQPI